jgi:hypothetical protein
MAGAVPSTPEGDSPNDSSRTGFEVALDLVGDAEKPLHSDLFEDLARSSD